MVRLRKIGQNQKFQHSHPPICGRPIFTFHLSLTAHNINTAVDKSWMTNGEQNPTPSRKKLYTQPLTIFLSEVLMTAYNSVYYGRGATFVDSL